MEARARLEFFNLSTWAQHSLRSIQRAASASQLEGVTVLHLRVLRRDLHHCAARHVLLHLPGHRPTSSVRVSTQHFGDVLVLAGFLRFCDDAALGMRVPLHPESQLRQVLLRHRAAHYAPGIWPGLDLALRRGGRRRLLCFQQSLQRARRGMLALRYYRFVLRRLVHIGLFRHWLEQGTEDGAALPQHLRSNGLSHRCCRPVPILRRTRSLRAPLVGHCATEADSNEVDIQW